MVYTWRVWKNGRFMDYVLDASEMGAYTKAKCRFGDNIWVERMPA